ncbi:ABC transporter substrate-binding protein [Jiella pelagia]|uniref:ABC transporter substrate-binding protein n=1 Tax=Jiella pelagia TaxID=2986949 RepID=A0ABY7BXJ6_9HYPH|nr:ABC transporter substrate-binding protein [Jiella pelagia]WAP67375.1 ABC transporter substrate-binding protein [Jiella pelagia]
MRTFALATLMAGLLASTAAQAEIKIGAILSLTGPAASLGIPEKQTIDVLPKEIDGEKVTYIIVDDASDPSAAVRAASKLINEDKVDVVLGPSITPTSLAILETMANGKTPFISAAGSAVIASPVEGPKTWAFKLAPQESSMAHYVYGSMEKAGDKTVGFIGFNDAFGDSFIGAFKKEAETRGIEVVSDERYSARDSSVTAQALSTVSANPDAVIIGASGTPGVAPILELRDLGYEGDIYINQGMANPDVLRVGGDALNGVMLAVSPVLVAEQLPDDNPVKGEALKYISTYEGKYGEGTRNLFGATVWDAFKLASAAAVEAKKTAEPGTVEFREALRNELESLRDVVGAQGVFNMSPTDHNGTDLRAESLVKIENGGWTYVPLD